MGGQLAVYTWQGCTLSVTGDPNYCYVGLTTPMRAYVNLHAFLQARRGRRSARPAAPTTARTPRLRVAYLGVQTRFALKCPSQCPSKAPPRPPPGD